MLAFMAALAERDQKLWVDLPDISALWVLAMMNLQPRSVGEAAAALVSIAL
jgi:hypothetical protein